MDAASERDLVNRFGLETEDAGRITINLNVISQDIDSRNEQRKMLRWVKNIQKMETQKLVMAYSLEVEKRKRDAHNKKIIRENKDNDSDGNEFKFNHQEDLSDDGASGAGPRNFMNNMGRGGIANFN